MAEKLWGADLEFPGAHCGTFHTHMDAVIEVPATDHRKLEHRDAPDQHPIEAISGLPARLKEVEKQTGQMLTAEDALSNVDIQAILNT